MVDASKITLKDVSDQVISNGIQSVVTPDFGAGIYAYSIDKKWYAGLSVPQLFQNKIVFKEIYSSSLSKLATHFYATGGYRYTINSDFKIEPSIMLKYVKPAPLQFDLGLRAIYRDKVWLGTVYRYLDAISVMMGYTMKQNLTFAYSYDFTTSNIRKYSTGTHEIVIGLRFHKITKPAEPAETITESAKLAAPSDTKSKKN
jgi:type IX secretion system PorP/SprF family membrane protein